MNIFNITVLTERESPYRFIEILEKIKGVEKVFETDISVYHRDLISLKEEIEKRIRTIEEDFKND